MNFSEWISRVPDFLSIRLMRLGDSEVTIATVLTTLLVIAATLVLARVAERTLGRAFRNKGIVEDGNVAVAGRLLYYAVAVTGLAIALHTFGLQLSALFAAGAVFAVGIGFGLQNVVQNFISGIILLGERSIKPGDILEIEGRMVRVSHMGLRAAVVRTLDEEDYIVPNSVLVQSNVKNFTMRDRSYRIRVPVGVEYSSDLDQVFEVLSKEARDLAQQYGTREPSVLMTAFGSSSIDFEVSLWIEDPWQHRRRRSEVAYAIWRAFRERGIVIAFPQLDVHFDQDAFAELSGGREPQSATSG